MPGKSSASLPDPAVALQVIQELGGKWPDEQPGDLGVFFFSFCLVF